MTWLKEYGDGLLEISWDFLRTVVVTWTIILHRNIKFFFVLYLNRCLNENGLKYFSKRNDNDDIN